MIAQEFADPHWEYLTERLRYFLRFLPGLKYPYDLGAAPQKTLAEYVPPAGFWTDRFERERQFFVCLPLKEFAAAYAALRVSQRLPANSRPAP